ncbi:MAG: cupin domain-containing protein [Anaerolineales bacterium]
MPSPSVSARPNCADSAVFLADVTISDNTKLKADQPFTKIWQLRNIGTCAWDAGYTLVFTGGIRQAAQPLGAYTLVGCVVGPGFEFGDFSLAADYPAVADAIRAQRERFGKLI